MLIHTLHLVDPGVPVNREVCHFGDMGQFTGFVHSWTE